MTRTSPSDTTRAAGGPARHRARWLHRGEWANAALPAPGAFDLVIGGEWVRGRVPYTRYVDPVSGEVVPPEGVIDPTRGPIVGVPVKVAAAPFRLTLGVRRRLVVPLRGGARAVAPPRPVGGERP